MSLYIGETQIGRVFVGPPPIEGEGDVFVVTVSWDETEEKWVPDCTYAEVAEAASDEKLITVQVDPDVGPDIAIADGFFDPEPGNSLIYWVRSYNSNRITEYSYLLSSEGLVLNDWDIYIATPTDSMNINENDTYDVTNYAEAVVNVPTGTARTESDITISGATVNVPAGLYSSAASKSVASGSVTAPSTISGTGSNVSASNNTLTLTKTVSVTPNVTTPGYISSGTAGDSSVSLSASVSTRSSSDLTASGATVTAPAGYYGSNATKTISSGSATPASSISATGATLSTGTNTLTLSKIVSNTPQVSAGYISSGTAGDSSVSLTANVTTKAAATYNTSSSDQTISSGQYLTGTQTIKAVTVSGLSANTILSGTTVKIGDANDDDRIASVSGSVTFQTYYTGSSAPSSAIGVDGDIYLQTS